MGLFIKASAFSQTGGVALPLGLLRKAEAIAPLGLAVKAEVSSQLFNSFLMKAQAVLKEPN